MKRCAIYTRKSTEEGLDQDFNSLDAQREACIAYIASQKHEGWRPLKANFDDGGFSGGTMDRPALSRLMDAVRNREVDVIVAYKVDRLSRSLMDFARMVEVFDQNGVSFVSVTQQFNTTDSMGRLTLNMLLSFAQFEREVTAERIRDKVAASKKKGMWMGGPVPLGYDTQDKKLVINQTEAGSIRQIFETYLEVKAVRRLKETVSLLNIRTRVRANGGGGKPLSRGHLYQILANPIYAGLIAHKGQTYPGLHDAIVDRSTWDAVQELLAQNATNRRVSTNTKSFSLLAGLLFDESGERLTPSHACKGDRRYRYYITHSLMQGDRSGERQWRLPAGAIETVVTDQLKGLMQDHARLEKLAREAEGSVLWDRVEATMQNLQSNDPMQCLRLIENLVRRVEVRSDRAAIQIITKSLLEMISDGGREMEEDILELVADVAFKKRGVERKIVMGESATPDPVLCASVQRAHRWLHELTTGEATSVSAIATRDKVSPTDISRDLQLAFLAPDIIEAILAGQQPPELTARRLRSLRPIPPKWDEQREFLGFDSIN